MKKKLRCLLKRFAALVASLVICFALCVPCFASNNASTQKWVIVAEEQRRGENGVLTKYFKLSPYSNGALYANTFQSSGVNIRRNNLDESDWWLNPINYPTVWRSSIPLGATSYVEISNLNVQYAQLTVSGSSSVKTSKTQHVYFFPLNSAYSYTLSNSLYSSASVVASPLVSYPIAIGRSTSHSHLLAGYFDVVVGDSEPVVGALSDKSNIVYAADPVDSQDLSFTGLAVNKNLDSADLIWGVYLASGTDFVNSLQQSTPGGAYWLTCSAVISYWVDANKLPAGLQVGDEFPSNTDAFDQLRDDLIDQFPEAADNIENGKATIQGWNDTETVDTDVASTSISALNAMFQNLGGFLFIVSLMVFGAVVLRMLIRKAVDG